MIPATSSTVRSLPVPQATAWQRGRPLVRPAPRARAPLPAPKAAGFHEIGILLADAASKPGSVEAPSFVLPLAAFVIAIVGGGAAIVLQPGDDAARKMQERDAKKFSKGDE